MSVYSPIIVFDTENFWSDFIDLSGLSWNGICYFCYNGRILILRSSEDVMEKSWDVSADAVKHESVNFNHSYSTILLFSCSNAVLLWLHHHEISGISSGKNYKNWKPIFSSGYFILMLLYIFPVNVLDVQMWRKQEKCPHLNLNFKQFLK